MEEDQIGSTRRSRRMRMTAGDMDDRGWTRLHIVARKGDLKQVFSLIFHVYVVYRVFNCYIYVY